MKTVKEIRNKINDFKFREIKDKETRKKLEAQIEALEWVTEILEHDI